MSALVVARLRDRGLLEIVQRHAAVYHVTVDEVCSRWRARSVIAARHAVWRELRETTSMSYPEIGALFDRDHTSILAAVRKVPAGAPDLAKAVRRGIAKGLLLAGGRR